MPTLIHSGSLRGRPSLPPGYEARTAGQDDTEAIGRVYHEAYPPGVAAETVEEAIADIAASFRGMYGPLWPEACRVVEYAGALVAAVLTVDRAQWEDVPDCPFTIELFTAPEHRRLGLGRALIAGCVGLAAARGEPLALRVLPDNVAALRLYRSLGFEEWRPPTLPT